MKRISRVTRQKKSLRTKRKTDDRRGTNPNSLSNLKPFAPGISGNPGGRPKLLSDAYREYLATTDLDSGHTHAQDIAIAQGDRALQGETSAARELRQATEGDLVRTLTQLSDNDLDEYIATRQRGIIPGIADTGAPPGAADSISNTDLDAAPEPNSASG